MKVRVAVTAVALAAANAAAGQPVELPPVRYPELAERAPGAVGFVPAGWSVLAERRGDLNGDGVADLALLLRMNDPANVVAVPLGDESRPFDTNPHWLLVALAERGGYRRVAQNRGLFPRPTAPWTGEVPPGAETIRLERGSLVVWFEQLRGWSSYRFRWQGGAMRLVGYDQGGVSGGCVGTISINYLTGRARVTAAPMSSDRTRTAWRSVRARPRPTLDTIEADTFIPEDQIAGAGLNCEGMADE